MISETDKAYKNGGKFAELDEVEESIIALMIKLNERGNNKR